MRVFVIGSYDYLDSFEWHIVDSLRHLGCVATLFHDGETVAGAFGLLSKASRKITRVLLREPELRVESRLLRAIDEFSPTVVLMLLGNQLSPKTIAKIRKRSRASIVCWCQDQMTTLGRQYLLGGGYDAVFVKDRYMQDLFSRMIRSTTFHYLPEACNPRLHRPIVLSDRDREVFGCDVMIAGTLYYYRQEILQQLADRKLKVWGDRPDWLIDRLPGRFMGRFVHGEDKVRAALGAKICLNTLHYAEVDGLNCRAFEISACGGFQMVSEVPVLKEHFLPDVEVATYRNVEELKEKVSHYVNHPEAAAAIADRGRQRAHRDHTYEHRLTEILNIALRS